MNTSQLFQVPLGDRELQMFRSPAAQPAFNPRNCGAVSGQLLGLVTPEISNAMTQAEAGAYVDEWINHLSGILRKPLYSPETPIDLFQNFFTNNLFPGFATLVAAHPVIGSGHFFVVAKSSDGQIMILDPQIRYGFRNSSEYFSNFRPPIARFSIIFHEASIPIAQHIQDSISILRNGLNQCSSDVEMSGGKRKKQRKTRRVRRSKKTLRRRAKA